MKAMLVVGLALAASVAGGCRSPAEPEGPARQCGLVVWHQSAPDARVEIIGDWNGWARPGVTPIAQADGWRAASLDLAPGEHAYAIIEDGNWIVDKNVPMTATYEDHEVSLASIPDCEKPLIRVDSVQATPAGDVTVHASFLAARGGSALDPSTLTADDLTVTSADPATGQIVLGASGLPRGKYTYRIAANDSHGVVADDARATAWVEARTDPWQPEDAVIYQVVLDRYRSAKGPLAPPKTPASRAGGTLKGLQKAIESGEITALGANAIWVSPLYANPTEDFPGADGRQYSSYHGYWPTASRALDPRVASEDDVTSFMNAAHSRGIRVLFDVVPNHVHQEHAWMKEHPTWFNAGSCVCGQDSCDWATHIQTCWFAPYLPDLDWNNVEAAHQQTEEVMWWFDRWGADGIRIDAVPMMPRNATRRIAAAVRARYAHPGNTPYVLGENFTGPGAYQSLKYDLGPFGLDGSFHFPLMWTLRDAIAVENSPMSDIETSFRAGEAAWDGANAVMGLILGNHDVSRFASVSAGSDGGDTWTPAPQPVDPLVYAKQRLALAALFTMPGAPVLYYGDEVGLAGKSDPDCRRVMPKESDLSASQLQTRAFTRTVGSARACSKALRRGTLRTLLADAEHFVFAREIPGETAIVTLSRRPTLPVAVPLPAGTFVDVLTGARVTKTLPVSADAFDAHVYVAADGGCTGASAAR